MQTLVGYRVIRQLGGGDASEVHLAHDPQGRTVVLRVLPAGYPGDVAVVDVDSEHVLPRVDVATLDDGRVVVVTPRLAGGTLGELLAARSALTAGECVTVLVSVSRGLAALHAAGWAHGRLDPSNILLSSDGVPVIAGLGRARPLDEDGETADRRRLAELGLLLLADLPGGRELLAVPEGQALLPEVLERRLFAFAAPEPLGRADPAAAPRALARPFEFEVIPDPVTPTLAGRVLAAIRASRGMNRRELVESLNRSVRSTLAGFAQVRRRTWIVAGCAALALVLATALIPGESTTRQADEIVATGPAPVSTGDSGGAPLVDATAESQETGDGSAGDVAAGDDPLAALEALLDHRERCFSALSAECLLSVDGSGTAALTDDTATLQRIANGAVAPPRMQLGDAPFVQRTGDSALIAGEQVSVLLVRGSDGWRIRDFFDAPGPAVDGRPGIEQEHAGHG